MPRSILPAPLEVGAAAVLVIAGCAGGAPTPTALRAEGTRDAPAGSPLSAPRLLAPPEGHVVAQDDPTTGCPDHPTHGHGFQVRFDWEDASSPAGIAGYDLHVEHLGAAYPALEAFVPASEHDWVACNSYVIDRNRFDWLWRVRARDGSGRVGEWSAERRFAFASFPGAATACATPGATAAR
jgi:hypothetical protein